MGLCIGKSCRTELFEGVVGEGCVEEVDLAKLVLLILSCWVNGQYWQVKPHGGGWCGTFVFTVYTLLNIGATQAR